MTLGTFSEELSKLVAIRNPTDFTLKRIPIGFDIVPIEATNVTNFLSLYNPVLFEDLEEPVSAYFFLKGNTKSFKPFALNWHFQRIEIKQIIDAVLKVKNIEEQSIVVAVEGSPGSGRTFGILATVYDMITKHRALAIRIPNSAINPIPTKESILTLSH